jgi:hypothetical protein
MICISAAPAIDDRLTRNGPNGDFQQLSKPNRLRSLAGTDQANGIWPIMRLWRFHSAKGHGNL